MDHIESKTKTDIIATEAYCGLLDQIMARKYVPNGNGAVQYFKDMKHDQFEANALDEDGEITDGQLIIFAKKAFLRCGHKTTSITDINVRWAKEDKLHRTQHPSTHQETRLERFCALLNTELKALYDSGETGVENQANQSTILNRMENLELV